MGRHLDKYYKAYNIKFHKVTVDIEDDLYSILLKLREHFIPNSTISNYSTKEIVNKALRDYFKNNFNEYLK